MAVTALARAVAVMPITEADVPRVARFLHANMNARVPVERWVGALDAAAFAAAPNAGFMLVDGDDIVGAHLAFYSERIIDGNPERFCNLGAWCVLPGHRFHGIRLLKALLRQPGYHFVDFSPSGNVVAINARLGFRHLDARTRLVPHLPWPWGRSVQIISDPAAIEALLVGDELKFFRDHARAQAARHLVLKQGDDVCYVIFRHERWKRVPRFVSILYVSNPPVFQRLTRRFSRHMFLHHRALGTLAEDRIVKQRPQGPSFRIQAPRPRMFRSETLQPHDIDYLYSELTYLAW
jgi:hypothetical protein